jgi:hypothetical protein
MQSISHHCEGKQFYHVKFYKNLPLDGSSYLFIAETQLFYPQHEFTRNVLSSASILLQSCVMVYNVLKLIQEPFVYLG